MSSEERYEVRADPLRETVAARVFDEDGKALLYLNGSSEFMHSFACAILQGVEDAEGAGSA